MFQNYARPITFFAALSSVIALAPPALADAEVTYEVVSGTITTADVRYFSVDGIQEEHAVSLPWRTTASVEDLSSLVRGAEVHAKWVEQPNTQVTVRIFADGKKVCEAVQRSGAASCNSAMSF
jgi:hypothetical protein